jgi:pimeloyl-ACP methyl ester carboxylesterase
MRPILTACVLLTALLIPGGVLAQEGAAQPSTARPGPLLTPKDHTELGRLLRIWFERRIADVTLANEEDKPGKERKRRKLADDIKEAKKRFWDEVEKRSPKDVSLLKSMADLKAIFAHAMPYQNQPATGDVANRTLKVGDDKQVTYAVSIPKSYRPDAKHPLLISLPTRTDDDKRWVDSKKHLENVWKGSPLFTESIVIAPAFPDDLELKDRVDLTKTQDTNVEEDRIRYFWENLAKLFVDYHLDTDRVFLECSPQSSLFGARLATYFPDRFAGLILREPGDLSSILPENLRYVPVCLVVSAAGEKTADAFLKRLDDLGIKTGKKIVSQGVAPFAEDNDEVLAWMKPLARDLFPKEITIAPTHERWRRAYWGTIEVCDPIVGVPAADRPSLVISCDPAQNRINVTSKGVQSFRMLLNDSLVNLDEKIVIFANGNHLWSGTWDRDRELLANEVLIRNDVNFLVVKMARFDIPQAPATPKSGEGIEKTDSGAQKPDKTEGRTGGGTGR